MGFPDNQVPMMGEEDPSAEGGHHVAPVSLAPQVRWEPFKAACRERWDLGLSLSR